MKRYKAVISNVSLDSHGDVLMKCVNKVGDELPLNVDFNVKASIGYAIISEIQDNGEIEADIHIDDAIRIGKSLSNFYAAIGGVVIESHYDPEGDVRIIDKFDIKEVGLTSNPSNKNLPPISFKE